MNRQIVFIHSRFVENAGVRQIGSILINIDDLIIQLKSSDFGCLVVQYVYWSCGATC